MCKGMTARFRRGKTISWQSLGLCVSIGIVGGATGNFTHAIVTLVPTAICLAPAYYAFDLVWDPVRVNGQLGIVPAIARCLLWKVLVCSIIALITAFGGRSVSDAGIVAIAHGVLLAGLEAVHNHAWERGLARRLGVVRVRDR